MSAVRPTAAPGSMPDSAGAQTSADRRGLVADRRGRAADPRGGEADPRAGDR
jgi:hypothetical protein